MVEALLIGLGFVAFCAWLVSAVSYFAMLGHSRIGWRLLFRMDWFAPSAAREYLTADGLPWHRRCLIGMAVFFAAILAAFGVGLVELAGNKA